MNSIVYMRSYPLLNAGVQGNDEGRSKERTLRKKQRKRSLKAWLLKKATETKGEQKMDPNWMAPCLTPDSGYETGAQSDTSTKSNPTAATKSGPKFDGSKSDSASGHDSELNRTLAGQSDTGGQSDPGGQSDGSNKSNSNHHRRKPGSGNESGANSDTSRNSNNSNSNYSSEAKSHSGGKKNKGKKKGIEQKKEGIYSA
ncbi:hypothetical protein HPP92_004551 [Vanilla planifolia]|uniref:Uncharacterized protein n=1 Tax=Vanilla planifolia TaxID=51239 RepID=A0A835RWY3_VANPL|nr:hypothetical protein HPP92_004551 [Vanilla planifolia]